MPLRMLLVYCALVSVLAAQNTPAVGTDSQKPVAAVLACPPAAQPIGQDPATFTWTAGSKIASYRLLLGPAPGSGRDGDTSLITGLKGQLAGLPPGQNLYVTLWSYEQNGNPVEPPSSCSIKTAPEPGVVSFKDQTSTLLSGVSLGSFSVAGSAESAPEAARACQAQCKQNAGCQGYTYYPAGQGNPTAMCDLKSQITETHDNECCVSALKIVTYEAPPARSTAPAPATSPNLVVSRPSGKSPVPVAPAPPPNATKGVSGDWLNQLGGVTRIVQKGNAISGTYSDSQQPSLTGTLQGTFDGKTLRATLNWKSGADSSHGSLLLTLTPQGRLEGTWTDASGVEGPWNMGPAGKGAR